MLLLLVLFIGFSSAIRLFAGDGLVTYRRNLLNGRVLQSNCTDYNDCYSLMCYFLSSPLDLVTIVPKQWPGNCSDLNNGDERVLYAEFSAYHDTIYKGTYESKSIAQASVILCQLAKDSTINLIIYDWLDCELIRPIRPLRPIRPRLKGLRPHLAMLDRESGFADAKSAFIASRN
jgi:hypothetical protein